MSSGPHVLVSGALNLLQDLSNGSNIPALQPLVNVAVRIYTSAEGAKTNKRKAKKLAEEVCNSVNQISKVYPRVPNSVTADLYAEGVIAFQRALEDVAAFVEKIGKRGLFWRFVYQKEDGEELGEYRTKITTAQLQFLASELAVSRRITADGAGALYCDGTTLTFHSPAHDVIQGLYGQSRMVLQRTSIQIISGVLEGMNHLRENNFALSNLKNEMFSIQYNGDKVILNVDLPKRKPRPKEEPTRASFSVPCEPASEHWDGTDISAFMAAINAFDVSSILESIDIEGLVDIHEQENEVLQTLFGLRAGFVKMNDGEAFAAVPLQFGCDSPHLCIVVRSIPGGAVPMDERARVIRVPVGVGDASAIKEIQVGAIKDKSKGDTLSKAMALFQGLWFITQCIARATQHLPVTELEVATLAFAVV
ncbi:hypothetical protein B0H14DRAFT_3430155 [Mycena olivaceomarginata]|nr:hypothetical protein B0H14DRAFT_3430155 [Mycena olivaceomarginata]